MRMTDHRSKYIDLNVVRFQSQIFASFASVQVKGMLHHFPTKANQPDITFSVVFRSGYEKEVFIHYVREHHINAVYGSSQGANPEVTLWWPERGMTNWTGFINAIDAGSDRFSTIHGLTFTVALVDSMIGRKTTMRSFGTSFSSVWGNLIPSLNMAVLNSAGAPGAPMPEDSSDSVIVPPSAPVSGGIDFGGGGYG
jgi:hypothetical protein